MGRGEEPQPTEPQGGGLLDALGGISGIGHTVLDVAGMIPIVGAVADLAHAGWYLAEGDYVNASLSAVSAIPGFGDAATAVKLANTAAIGLAGAAAAARNADNAADTYKTIDGVVHGPGFTVKESKFDYFFGRVTSGPQHNIDRSRQNLEDLRKLGIDEAAGGKDSLLRVFKDSTEAPEISRRTSEYGTTITRRAEVSGEEATGAIDVKYFHRNHDLNATPEISTIIPKIYS
ncbi:MAG: hypothetical protein RBJ76_05075 [Stenomitos frigidus ULC029]